MIKEQKAQAIARIQAFRARWDIPQRHLARLAGLHENTLRGMKELDWSPSLETIDALQAVIEQYDEAREGEERGWSR